MLDTYVRSRCSVHISDNGHLEYGIPKYDQDDMLDGFTTFVCDNCGVQLATNHHPITSERDLLILLDHLEELRKEVRTQ